MGEDRETLQNHPSPNTQEMGFSVEISPMAAREFFRASAVSGLEAAPEAQKKSPLLSA
jgi:hypothetical protein